MGAEIELLQRAVRARYTRRGDWRELQRLSADAAGNDGFVSVKSHERNRWQLVGVIVKENCVSFSTGSRLRVR